ncbi:MAG TPA: BON domain-containing protein [Acidimicrobiales bacterium]|jgi:hyperosmotically inducible periplasmic protein|nr:BON domain-containing protein [Acidimicrobiales bacterium]
MARRGRLRALWWGALGACGAYYFDPDRGRSRRARLADQVASARRQRQKAVEAEARYQEGQLQGDLARAAGAGTFTPEDDIDIANEVHAAISGLDAATSDVTVEVVDGVATLRGQLATPAAIDEVTSRVRAVAGVVEVRSFLHLPGTPAPNKAASLAAS